MLVTEATVKVSSSHTRGAPAAGQKEGQVVSFRYTRGAPAPEQKGGHVLSFCYTRGAPAAEFRLDLNDFGFTCAGVSNVSGYRRNA